MRSVLALRRQHVSLLSPSSSTQRRRLRALLGGRTWPQEVIHSYRRVTSDILDYVPVLEPSLNVDARGHRARIHTFHASIETVRYTVVLKCPTDGDNTRDMRPAACPPSSFIAAAVWIRIRSLRHGREGVAFSVRCGDNESIHWSFNVIRQLFRGSTEIVLPIFVAFVRSLSIFMSTAESSSSTKFPLGSSAHHVAHSMDAAGQPLTTPVEPRGNQGWDNEHNDLIVYTHDVLFNEMTNARCVVVMVGIHLLI